MKRIHILILLAAIYGCARSAPELPNVAETQRYVGTVTVLYEGEYFDNNDKSVSFSISDDGLSGSLTIYRIRFVPKMPVSIDVTVPAVDVSRDGDRLHISCDNVVPWALGGEFLKYLVTGLEGEINGTHLSFSLNFGEYPTSFSGTLQLLDQ